MSEANEVTSPTTAGSEIKRLVMRYRCKVACNSKKYDGNESQYTFHGGFTSGYDAGKLSAYEDIADILGVEIDA